jgi:hypothetical protein
MMPEVRMKDGRLWLFHFLFHNFSSKFKENESMSLKIST